MAEMFEAEGFALDRVTCLNMADDRDMARIALDDLTDLRPRRLPALTLLFISCTAVRAAGVIDRIEACNRPARAVVELCRRVGGGAACGWQGALAPGQLMTLALGAP